MTVLGWRADANTSLINEEVLPSAFASFLWNIGLRNCRDGGFVPVHVDGFRFLARILCRGFRSVVPFRS